MALLVLIVNLSGAIDDKLYTVEVFIDLAMAFDTVDLARKIGALWYTWNCSQLVPKLLDGSTTVCFYEQA